MKTLQLDSTQQRDGVPGFTPRSRKALSSKTTSYSSRALRIALIEPHFEPSISGHEYMLQLLPGTVKAESTGGALALLAAFIKPPHEVTIFVENVVGKLDLETLKSFDIVGLTGMIVQRTRMREILLMLQEYEGIVTVGGPYASVDPSFFSNLCDAIFVGEADQTWPAFLESLTSTECYSASYKQAERTDMTTLPLPRYDLLQAKHYRTASVQFSRGCPFQCEFCDIITIFGRKPRAKSPDQIIAELNTLRALGFRSVYLVDDNFIGNKKLAKELLYRMVEWQEANSYPIQLSTEATIDLANEPELLDLMYKANFRSVFIGLESPNSESLIETRKIQNVRLQGETLEMKVSRIRDAGLVIVGGFMLGFDNDGPDIFDRQFAFISKCRIARPMVSILTAIPSTPLYDRLQSEGRLRLDDPSCNFVPKQMSSAQLSEGYLGLTKALYEPDAFFERLLGGWNSSQSFRERWLNPARRVQKNRRKRLAGLLSVFVVGTRLLRVLAKDNELGNLARAYVRNYWQYRRTGAPGIGMAEFIYYAAIHWHCYKFFKDARGGGLRVINTYSYSEDDDKAPATVRPPILTRGAERSADT